ncbi:MAG: DUF1492 domain-containing protein [Lachnospiraceae bacterium]
MDKEQIKAENSRKKKYLRGYKWHSRRINRIEAEIEEIRSMKQNPSLNNDGMPAGSEQSDLSKYVAELDELERELYEEGVKQVKVYKDISSRIRELTNENEQDVMFYRYIKDMEFWDIAQKMGYSERQVHRFHGDGLVHLLTPEK